MFNNNEYLEKEFIVHSKSKYLKQNLGIDNRGVDLYSS